MKEIKLLKYQHPTPFDADGNATMCVQEYTAYLAGEPHSDTPKCVSPVLTAFMMQWNDDLDDETRQRLRPYAVRQLGTAGDGQDKVRSYMALDWLIRVNIPAFLAAAGLTSEAAKLRGLDAIKGFEQARAARSFVSVASAAAWETAGAAIDAARAFRAARDAARAAASAAARVAVRDIARDIPWAIAWDTTGAAASAAQGDTLASTVDMLQESAFGLLERMIDPAGLHDIKTERELLEQSGRELLVFAGDTGGNA